MALKSNCPTLPKIGENEEMFTLRAQDVTSPLIVCEWISHNIMTAPADKLHEALDCALRMRDYSPKKSAD